MRRMSMRIEVFFLGILFKALSLGRKDTHFSCPRVTAIHGLNEKALNPFSLYLRAPPPPPPPSVYVYVRAFCAKVRGCKCTRHMRDGAGGDWRRRWAAHMADFALHDAGGGGVPSDLDGRPGKKKSISSRYTYATWRVAKQSATAL